MALARDRFVGALLSDACLYTHSHMQGNCLQSSPALKGRSPKPWPIPGCSLRDCSVLETMQEGREKPPFAV